MEQDASPLDDIRQAVLEQVRGGRNRLWNMPDYYVDECVVGDNYPAANQGYSLHVGKNANT